MQSSEEESIIGGNQTIKLTQNQEVARRQETSEETEEKRDGSTGRYQTPNTPGEKYFKKRAQR